MSDNYMDPSKLKSMTKDELAYKLAMLYSFIEEIDAESYLPRFEKKYEEWYKGVKKTATKETPVSMKPEEFTEEKMAEMFDKLGYLWEMDNHDRDRERYDLDLMFDNIDEGGIDYKKNADYCPCNKTVEEYVSARYEGKLTVDDFLDKWLAIIRSKTIGQFDGSKLVEKCLDMQDSQSVYSYLGCRDADKYTDDDIREFFRRCWYD